MAIASVEFVAQTKGASLDDFEFEVEMYLSGLRSNGQIERDYLIEYQGRQISAVCQLPRLNSHLPRYCSAFGRERLKALLTVFGSTPQWTNIIKGRSPIRGDWQKADFLFLHTDFLDTGSPVTIPGESVISVPTFTLPLAELTRARLKCWADAFQHLESVWMDSGVLEGRAYREYADPNSDFSKDGRELARTVENELGTPVYYFLHRGCGRTRNEEKRVCPGCGGKWRLKPNAIEKLGPMIAFKCTPCRLLSEDIRRIDSQFAKYGEYRKPR